MPKKVKILLIILIPIIVIGAVVLVYSLTAKAPTSENSEKDNVSSGGETAAWNLAAASDAATEIKSENDTRKSSDTGTDLVINTDDDEGHDSSDTNSNGRNMQSDDASQNADSTSDDPNQAGNINEHSGIIVVIDPGHTGAGQDTALEPLGPGSSEMKKKNSSGTAGKYSGLAEYQLNMIISKALRTELENRGYTVYLTHETDIKISNVERAQFATEKNATVYIRIHANGSTDTSVNGALTIAPTDNNAFLGDLIAPSQKLSQILLDEYCKETGMANKGVWYTDTMTGNNWATMPVSLIEMGYMSNKTDDLNMADPDYQVKIVNGIANGIDAYFAGN
ncbi:MAG: N-acetylmuramoyl-L-alanine amidase [Lachnospiraceae bacterium]|jgi:N-acetylmuramoyl-L-alanine amidase|nr:N-acetylmuramoyl-L-alanine amidase [Lachnospiraceae bacterium]